MPDNLRYSCQIALPGIGESGQSLLQQARVLVVGAGGLGCPAAQYLSAAGIGTLAIADDDVVSISNLHRQVLYTPEDAGKKKANVAQERLQRQNPGIRIIAVNQRVTSGNVLEFIEQYDIVVDCTDNFDTRYLLNDAAVLAGKPLVYGAIYQFEGQVAVWNITAENGSKSPNYRDLFPKVDASQIPNCTEGGVVPTLAGIIGCMQANEVIKYITQTGELLSGKMLVFDAQSMQSRVIKIGEVSQVNIVRLAATSTLPNISPAELRKAIESGSVQLVDVRTFEERQRYNIGGKHIPLDELSSQIDKFDQQISTVFYCASGKRSQEAVKVVLNNYPAAKVFSLKGGLQNWLGKIT